MIGQTKVSHNLATTAAVLQIALFYLDAFKFGDSYESLEPGGDFNGDFELRSGASGTILGSRRRANPQAQPGHQRTGAGVGCRAGLSERRAAARFPPGFGTG
jgi:hypothetical protein